MAPIFDPYTSLTRIGMRREVQIVSYFTIPTDLAAEMRPRAEFESGSGYSVDLRSGDEYVEVRLEQADHRYVVVKSNNAGALFDRVLGRVIHALGMHSDNLMVDRISRANVSEL